MEKNLQCLKKLFILVTLHITELWCHHLSVIKIEMKKVIENNFCYFVSQILSNIKLTDLKQY